MQKIDASNKGEARTLNVRITDSQMEFLEALEGTKSEVIRSMIDHYMIEKKA